MATKSKGATPSRKQNTSRTTPARRPDSSGRIRTSQAQGAQAVRRMTDRMLTATYMNDQNTRRVLRQEGSGTPSAHYMQGRGSRSRSGQAADAASAMRKPLARRGK